MTRIHALLAGFSISATLGFAAPALAGPTPACPALSASSTCTADGQTFTLTGGTSGNGLTFLAEFTTANQSNSSIASEVDAFLAAEGYSGVMYLGRQDGSGLVDGDHVHTSSSDGGFTGTWTLDPGTTNDIGSFIAIHAGGGQTDELYKINSPGLSGTWSTFDSANLSNFDLFGTDPPPPLKTPEPMTIALLGAGLAGAAAMRRRKAAKRA